MNKLLTVIAATGLALSFATAHAAEETAKPKTASTPKKTSGKGRGHTGFPAALPSTKPAP